MIRERSTLGHVLTDGSRWSAGQPRPTRGDANAMNVFHRGQRAFRPPFSRRDPIPVRRHAGNRKRPTNSTDSGVPQPRAMTVPGISLEQISQTFPCTPYRPGKAHACWRPGHLHHLGDGGHLVRRDQPRGPRPGARRQARGWRTPRLRPCSTLRTRRADLAEPHRHVVDDRIDRSQADPGRQADHGPSNRTTPGSRQDRIHSSVSHSRTALSAPGSVSSVLATLHRLVGPNQRLPLMRSSPALSESHDRPATRSGWSWLSPPSGAVATPVPSPRRQISPGGRRVRCSTTTQAAFSSQRRTSATVRADTA